MPSYVVSAQVVVPLRKTVTATNKAAALEVARELVFPRLCAACATGGAATWDLPQDVAGAVQNVTVRPVPHAPEAARPKQRVRRVAKAARPTGRSDDEIGVVYYDSDEDEDW